MTESMKRDLKLIAAMANCMDSEDKAYGFEIGCKVAEEQIACYLEELFDYGDRATWEQVVDTVRTGKYLEKTASMLKKEQSDVTERN